MTRQGTTARGYGSQHQAERRRWEPIVATGNVICARRGPKCIGQPIAPDQSWDLGHSDDRKTYTGPECVPCNRGAGATNSNAARKTITRDW